MGYLYGIISLVCDAYVSHYQENLKLKRKQEHKKSMSFYDFTLGTNIYMYITSLILSLVTGEFLHIGRFF